MLLWATCKTAATGIQHEAAMQCLGRKYTVQTHLAGSSPNVASGAQHCWMKTRSRMWPTTSVEQLGGGQTSGPGTSSPWLTAGTGTGCTQAMSAAAGAHNRSYIRCRDMLALHDRSGSKQVLLGTSHTLRGSTWAAGLSSTAVRLRTGS